ncbi:hypothetical protein KVT40_001365 [Elsinoe batatas]|uniref:Sec39 domain-containing protein n=1 Tax=Elsinoe batatas TaxID=2601811 RepID=A0A8K0PH83_9PEZI|nr:hypothetical protein KVT40_001365 [Elsinoe batatas]
MAEKLSKSQCILLAVNFASDSQAQALRQLFLLRSQDLPPELVLRIVLTYLPGVTPPAQYVDLIQAVTSAEFPDNDPSRQLDVSSINGISEKTANKRLRSLTLLPLSPSSWPADAPDDILTRFLCHRGYRIDEETGLITLLPDLVRPFLQQSEYLRLWFISAVLPLLRLPHEYHLDTDPAAKLTVEAFEKIDGYHGTELLLSGARNDDDDVGVSSESAENVGRDLKCLVGPWLYGHTSRKRRKLNGQSMSESEGQLRSPESQGKTDHSWEHVNAWLVRTAVSDFATATAAIDDWDGPIDVDLGGYANSGELMDDDERAHVERRYAQASIACCYAVGANTEEVVRGAHGVLSRLSELLDFEPPPDLATSVEQLPHVDTHMSEIHATDSMLFLEPHRLMDERHPLTEPSLAAYMLLQMLVYSSYQLLSLDHPISIVNVTKLRFFSDEEEQLPLLKTILHSRSQQGKRDEMEWMNDRAKILWLWNWNIDPDEHAQRGSGPFGNIPKETLEREILVGMLATGNYHLVEKVYIHAKDRKHRLNNDDLEEIILTEAMKSYDNASNGNKNRGNMKKADDIAAFFLRLFPESLGIARASALIHATHSMSFYSLSLQHGVPFQPVAIRASSDPLTFIELILEQNPRSYTKLDDLINIGRNLAIAAPETDITMPPSYQFQQKPRPDVAQQAERRVIYMCISSALTSGDFDTAYSYLTSRLQPSFTLPDSPKVSKSQPKKEEDDISWRAAFLAGRTAPTSQAQSLDARIRRLEQRTELLSLAMLLAPTSSLIEILGVYRRVEEEMTALLAQQAAEEEEHDSVLDRQRAGQANASVVPGGFGGGDVFDGRTFNQTTRAVGNFSRGYNSTEAAQKSRPAARGEEEAPVGLFDLARGAASALGRNAFPLRSASGASSIKEVSTKSSPQQKQAPFGSQPASKAAIAAPADDGGDEWGAWGEEDATAKPSAREGDEEEEAWGWNDETASPRPGSSGTGGWGASSFHSEGSGGERRSGERVRRRDMVANAVTGGLASGIGWVLGATPADQQDKR